MPAGRDEHVMKGAVSYSVTGTVDAMMSRAAGAVAACLLVCASLTLAQGQTPSQAAGLTLQALSPEDLDAIQEQTGYRVGVLVTAVAAGSPAAAVLRAGDVLFLVADKPVASPQDVDAALQGKAGAVRVAALRPTEDGSGELVDATITIPGTGAAAAPAPAGPDAGDQQEKLKALDAALAAGVITQAEYDQKKAALQAQTPAAHPQTQEKLRALDGARQAGIISEAEYQQKRAALLGPAPVTAPTGGAAGDPLTAYLDMLDFVRSEAWGRQLATPPAERQRLAQLLQEADAETRQAVEQELAQVPPVWADLQRKWAAADDQRKAEQRELWRKQVLLPSFVYPPPLETETFRAPDDRVVFERPKDWIMAQAEDEGTQYLYMGPPGTETTWEQVADPAASPPGAFFAILPLPDELRNVEPAEGVRILAQQYVCPPGANMSEVGAEPLGDGVVLTLRGTYPGSQEERFYWVGLVKYGPDHLLAGRLGGPLSKADQLVPVFAHMIMTMELNPPTGGGDEYHSAMVGYYAARVGNIVNSSW